MLDFTPQAPNPINRAFKREELFFPHADPAAEQTPDKTVFPLEIGYYWIKPLASSPYYPGEDILAKFLPYGEYNEYKKSELMSTRPFHALISQDKNGVDRPVHMNYGINELETIGPFVGGPTEEIEP